MELKDNPELVDKFRRGDRETLAALYVAHVEAVEEFLRGGFSFSSRGEAIRFRGFREPFELQEVLQEGFVRAFRQSAREHYDASLSYRPYLITIFRNLVIDRFRRQSTERRLFVNAGRLATEGESPEEAVERMAASQPALVGEPGYSPELEAMRSQVSQVLRAFVETLDDVDSTILQQHLMGEMSQSDVAEVLGMSRNDLRKRLRQMRERLLRHLKTEGVISRLDPEELFRTMMIFAVMTR